MLRKGDYGRRRYNETVEAEAIAGWLWHRYEQWKEAGAPDSKLTGVDAWEMEFKA